MTLSEDSQASTLQRVRKAWNDFNRFVGQITEDEDLRKAAARLANLYVAMIEMQELRTEPAWRDWLKVLRSLFHLCFYKPDLSALPQVAVFNIQEETDSKIASSIGGDLVTWTFRPGWVDPVESCFLLSLGLRLCWRMWRSRELDRSVLIGIFSSALDGVAFYQRVSVNGIKVLVTQRDRYPIEQAILLKARESGIPSIKFDCFMHFSPDFQKILYCDYYFFPNHTSRENFLMYDWNRWVKPIEGGFPSWDELGEVRRPLHLGALSDSSSGKKILLFASQYGFKSGFHGRYPSSFYLEEILSVLPDDFIVYLKPHPLDTSDELEKFSRHPSVRILKAGEFTNLTLFAMAHAVFSICSQFTLEAKHVCESSFYINYDLEFDSFQYDKVGRFVDVIRNRDQLKEVLTGERRGIERETFLKGVNMGFPKSRDKLRELVQSLENR